MDSFLDKIRGRGAVLPPRMPGRQIALAGLGADLAFGFVAALHANV